MKIKDEAGLFRFLMEEKGYTEDEAEETLIRREIGLEIPEEIRAACNEYYSKRNS